MKTKELWTNNWKTIVGTITILILGIGLGKWNIQPDTSKIPKMFLSSNIGTITIALLHLSGLYIISQKKAGGWALIATAFFFMSQWISGFGSFLIFLLSVSFYWTWIQWKTPAKR